MTFRLPVNSELCTLRYELLEELDFFRLQKERASWGIEKSPKNGFPCRSMGIFMGFSINKSKINPHDAKTKTKCFEKKQGTCLGFLLRQKSTLRQQHTLEDETA